MRNADGLALAANIGPDFQAVVQPAKRKRKGKHIRRRKTPSPITLRLTDDERARLKHLSAGMSISAYIRKCMFGDKATRRKRRTHVAVKDQEAIARVLGLLGKSRIANNLNQLAFHANTGSLLIDEETLGRINEAHEHVCCD